jgi:predicted amidohydrolase YtcJ
VLVPVARRIASVLIALAGVALAAACAGTQGAQRADLVLLNGHVVTVDSTRPEAEAIAIHGDRILAVGTSDEMRKLAPPSARIIELAGRLAIPGFIEGHGHYTALGESKLVLDLTTARTWDDIVAMVDAAVKKAKPGEWITGRGWHQEKWTAVPQPNVEGVPLHASLDRVSADNPVVLEHASGHASFVNGRALTLAGVTRATPNPPGGEIVKDPSGEPTGLLREHAQGLVGKAQAASEHDTPAQREARFREVVRLAGEEALSHGVTTFHDAGSSFATIDGYKKLADEGALPIRLYVMVRFETNEAMDAKMDAYRMIGYGNGFLTVRSIKRQIDGALGSHGAWLLQPYTDLPTSSGLALDPPAELEAAARIAMKHGYQVNTHAIGDRANRETLDIYERIFRGDSAAHDLRWRVEHAQHIDPADVPRFRQLGLIASMQGIHTISDGPWVAKRLGEARTKATSYLWRSLLDEGVVVTNGTDVPVESIDPIASFYGSVTRITKEGTVFLPEQRITRAEGLRAYTLSNAYAAFEEQTKGSLTPGKLADVVVLSADIMRVPDDQIRSAKVDLTVLGGKVRYERK